MNELRFFNPYAEIQHSENVLPHWQQAGAVYFVTFRLADAIPTKLRNQWREEREIWLQLHPYPWTPASSRSITSDFPRRLSGGSTRVMAHAFYGSPNAQRSLMKRFDISMAN